MRVRVKVITAILCTSIFFTGCGLSNANRNYSKGLDSYKEQDYKKAADYLEQAIKANDDKAEYHIDYGFTLIQLKMYEEALEQFKRVIMDKNIPMVKANNKKAYRGIGICYLMQDEYEKAIESFELALGIEENKELNRDILYYESSALEHLGKTEEAIAIYTKILEGNDKDISIYKARANSYQILGEFELSVADYNKALELDKDDFSLYLGKFAALKELGKEEEALKSLEEASNIKIETKQDMFELSKVHFYRGDFTQALNGFGNAIDNGITEAYFFLGEICLEQNDFENAIKNFEAYLDSGNKVSGLFYNQLVTCYLKTGDLEKAETYIKKAKKLSDPSVKYPLLKNEIIFLEKTGQFKEALGKIETYKKKYPEDMEAQKDYYFLKTRVEGADLNKPVMEDNNTVEKP